MTFEEIRKAYKHYDKFLYYEDDRIYIIVPYTNGYFYDARNLMQEDMDSNGVDSFEIFNIVDIKIED